MALHYDDKDELAIWNKGSVFGTGVCPWQSRTSCHTTKILM